MHATVFVVCRLFIQFVYSAVLFMLISVFFVCCCSDCCYITTSWFVFWVAFLVLVGLRLLFGCGLGDFGSLSTWALCWVVVVELWVHAASCGWNDVLWVVKS